MKSAAKCFKVALQYAARRRTSRLYVSFAAEIFFRLVFATGQLPNIGSSHGETYNVRVAATL